MLIVIALPIYVEIRPCDASRFVLSQGGFGQFGVFCGSTLDQTPSPDYYETWACYLASLGLHFLVFKDEEDGFTSLARACLSIEGNTARSRRGTQQT